MSTDGTRIIFDAEALESIDARRRFLSQVAMAAGAVALAPMILRGHGITELLAQGVDGETEPNLTDTDILNYALTLEYLEATFYLRADSGGTLPGGAAIADIDPDGTGVPGTVAGGLGGITPPAPATFSVADFVRAVRDHEITHVQALQAALAANALVRTDFSFDFPGAFDSASNFLNTALVLEDTGVTAYLGQAGNIDDASVVLPTAGAILGVEAEHASTFRLLLALPVTVEDAAFDTPKTSAEVVAAAGPFITSMPPLPFPK